jgi:PAS domain S-box-containing protein
MLLTFAVVGGLAVAVTVYRRLDNEEYLRASLYAISYFAVLAAALSTRIPYLARAVTLVMVIFCLGIVELHLYGLGSMNPPLFLCAIFFASGLIGYNAGLAFLGASLSAYCLYAYIYLATDFIPILYDEQKLSLDWMTWVTFVSTITFLAIAGIKSRRLVMQGLLEAAEGNAELLLKREQEFAARQSVEAALRDREERYKSLIEHTSDAIWCYEFDPPIPAAAPMEEQFHRLYDGVLVECNDACAMLYGLGNRSKALGKTFREVTGGTSSESLDEFFRLFIEQGYRLQNLVTGDYIASERGRVFDNSAQGVMARGHLIRVWGSCRDVTERHVAEAAREEAQTRYRTLVRNLPGAVYRGVLGTTVQATYLSPWFQTITGMPAAEIVRPDCDFWGTVVFPEDRTAMRAAVDAAASERRAYAIEYRVNHADGGFRWVSDRGVVVQSGSERLIEGVIFDITARKEAEDAIRRSESHLLQAQKLEAVGQLAGGIAHDFNNVLQGILGYSEMGMRRKDVPATPAGYFLRINTAAQRAAGIVNQLLAFSRNEPAAVCSVDAADVAQGTADLIGPLLGERITLRLDLPPQIPRVRCDETQLQQVMLNLALNARDAMPSGGLLEIAVRDEAGPADPTAARQEGARHVQLRVRDSGSGISSEALPHIFEPFFTTKPLNEGTGLGLSTVYGIVTQYGGSIDVDSQPGLGATFTVRLPLATETDPLPQHPAAKKAPDKSAAARLLFAEDEPLVREAMTQILGDAGYEVVEASDGLHAFELFRDAPEDFDILLFDVVMPRLNGTEALARIRAIRPGIPVLLLTGYSADQITEELLSQPDTELLSKPVDRGTLLETLSALRRGATVA